MGENSIRPTPGGGDPHYSLTARKNCFYILPTIIL
jgi:hypothetical protein